MNKHSLNTLLAAGLLTALPAAWAAPADPTPAAPAPAATGTPVRGQVTAVDATAKTITLQDRRNQTTSTLHVNDATKYLVDGTGAVSDIKAGQTIRVIGQTTGTTVTARMIQVIPTEEAGQPAPQFGGRGGGGGGANFSAVQGVVATVTPTLTITTSDKQTDTVQTDTDTRVTTSHDGTLADVKPQENVSAITTGTGDAAVATSVHVRQAGGYGGRRRGGNAPGAAPAAPAAPADPATPAAPAAPADPTPKA